MPMEERGTVDVRLKQEFSKVDIRPPNKPSNAPHVAAQQLPTTFATVQTKVTTIDLIKPTQQPLTPSNQTHGLQLRPALISSSLSGSCPLASSTMYPPPEAGDYQKYGYAATAPAPSAPAPAQGIPVSSMNQSYPMPVAPLRAQAPGPWATGLCGCCDDCSNCCITCWCPCITFGQIAEIVDRGTSSCAASGAIYALIMLMTGCACCYSCFYRSKLRRQYALGESPCADCLVHCCCEACALCQEYRELKARGFDMSIGWHGNLERQTPGVQMVPPVQSGMTMNR